MDKIQKANALYLRSTGLSFAEIAGQLEVSTNTVKSFCLRHKGCQFCLNCGTQIQQPPRTRQKKFCSDKCRMKWWNTHTEEVNRKAIYNFVCKCCGKPFQAYGNNHRKYCSNACYVKARFGGNKDGIS